MPYPAYKPMTYPAYRRDPVGLISAAPSGSPPAQKLRANTVQFFQRFRRQYEVRARQVFL
ncbi:hypothetical protein SAMN04487787_101429 [Kosakonia sacchari]|nr:hypothetical protein SAMN04487787_101429 [Kosakonia sacchari]